MEVRMNHRLSALIVVECGKKTADCTNWQLCNFVLSVQYIPLTCRSWVGIKMEVKMNHRQSVLIVVECGKKMADCTKWQQCYFVLHQVKRGMAMVRCMYPISMLKHFVNLTINVF